MAVIAFLAAVFSPAYAVNFSIAPTSLELSGAVKSGAFSVINSGKEKLNCQITVKEWSQDVDGKDVYAEAKDIVFFPKIMTVESNEQRAIRIGVKVPAGTREKTYRLFVEEIPSQKKEQEVKSSGKKITAGLTIAFRYAIPIFVKPFKQQESAALEDLQMSRGVVKAFVRNTGNIHLKLLSVTFRGTAADGRELFSREVAGWYILHGRARPYEVAVPQEVCDGLSTVEVSVKSENSAVNGTMNVQKTMCTQ